MFYAESRSDIGKVRSQNQDAVFVSMEPVGPLPNLFIVADGMGGHNAGEVASNQAVSLFCEYVRRNTDEDNTDGFLDIMVSAAVWANSEIYAQSVADPALNGMGTTFTACVLHNGKCEIVHVGDSRAYLIKDERITQLTTDHSYVHEMVKAGQLTQSEAREHPKRNILTRVMGVDPDMAVDGYVREAGSGCALLLCSDGLTNMLTDEAILATVCESSPLTERVDALITQACQRGGNDNISVILIINHPFGMIPTEAGE